MGLNKQITSTGSLGLFDITDDLVIRIVTEGAGPSNAIVVKGRIKGQSSLNTLQTIIGSISTTVTVATYEEIEIDCTVYNSVDSGVKVIVTSFDQDITSLASIDEKLPALTNANRVPVDIGGASVTIEGDVIIGSEVEISNDVGNPVPISGTVTANTGLAQPLTDAQLRASAVPVSGTVTANTGLSQPLTDAQLRASAVPVSGPLTDAQLRASAVPVSGPLTDAQLRASAVPVTIDKDRELISVAYIVNTGFTGASVNDIVTGTHIYETSGGSPTLVTSIWRNETLNTTLASAPAIANLTLNLGLTNAELRASVVSVAPNISRGAGAVDSSTTRVTVANDGPLMASVGNPSDAAASSDTGTFAIIPFIKRALQNWTTLLARIPALVGNRIPIEPLSVPGVARQLSAGATSTNTALTTNITRISIFARNADIRFSIGSTAQTASATSHYIALGERLDFTVPATPNIAVIRAGTVDAVLEVTEL